MGIEVLLVIIALGVIILNILLGLGVYLLNDLVVYQEDTVEDRVRINHKIEQVVILLRGISVGMKRFEHDYHYGKCEKSEMGRLQYKNLKPRFYEDE